MEQLLRVGGRLRRSGLFPEAPHGNFTEAEGVPPEVEHGLIETEDPGASDGFGGWDERGEAGVDLCALGRVGAGDEMPEGQRIVRAGFRKYFGERGAAVR